MKAQTVLGIALTLVASASLAKPHQLIINDAYLAANGTTISGDFQSTITDPAITIRTSTPVTIDSATFSGPGDMVNALNGNVIIRNAKSVGTNTNVVGQQTGSFFHGDNVLSLRIENCTMSGHSTSIIINGYGGNKTTSQTIKITNNIIRNNDGRPSDGNDGRAKGGPFAAAVVQYVNANNLPGMEFAWNEITNENTKSYALATISLFDSGGTKASHFLVHDNFIQSPPTSGSGLVTNGLAGDTASGASQFVEVYNNQFIGNSTYGIQFSFGHDNSAYNNRVLNSGYASDGTFVASQGNVGLYNVNLANQPSTVFFNNLMANNLVGWISSNGRSDWSLPGQANNLANNSAWQPNDNTHPTLQDERNEYQAWLVKVGRNNITLGAQ